MRISTLSLFSALTISPLVHGYWGTIIMGWLNSVGIKYVPPVVPPTCTDCSRGRSPRHGRLFWEASATCFRLPLPCCPGTEPPPLPTARCTCGIEGSTRIVGGTDSTYGKYPWIGVFNFKRQDNRLGGCAGTLVAANWIVTAAHCVRAQTKNTMSIVLGEFDISTSTDVLEKEVKLAEDPIVHECYGTPKKFSNDIALLKLAEDVDLTVYTPACLPQPDDVYTGQTGNVYGWGLTGDSCSPYISTVLQEVEVSIVSDVVCEAASSTSAFNQSTPWGCVTVPYWSYINQISSDMVCAGAAGKSPCHGDSGGPLTVKNALTKKHDLVGVVSWGSGCATDGLYGVYAEVAKHRTWIDRTIAANGGASFCSS